jgi:hypothetical protein
MAVNIQFSTKRYLDYIVWGSLQKKPLYLVQKRKTFNYKATKQEDGT